MVRFRLFPLFHHFSSSLPDWSADSGFYLPPPCRNNSSLVALHLRIHPASSSTASCHPSPTNFPITTCDSGGELLSLLLLNLPVSCGIILKRTLLFKTHFATLLVKSALAKEERSWFSWSIVWPAVMDDVSSVKHHQTSWGAQITVFFRRLYKSLHSISCISPKVHNEGEKKKKTCISHTLFK